MCTNVKAKEMINDSREVRLCDDAVIGGNWHNMSSVCVQNWPKDCIFPTDWDWLGWVPTSWLYFTTPCWKVWSDPGLAPLPSSAKTNTSCDEGCGKTRLHFPSDHLWENGGLSGTEHSEGLFPHSALWTDVLPSGKRYRASRCKSNRYKLSFIQQSFWINKMATGTLFTFKHSLI